LDAVKQWEYERPLVKGKPAAIVMIVTVKFK